MKNVKQNLQNNKATVTFEDDDCISIWKYDFSKSQFNPIDVEYKWKKNFNPWDNKKKTLGDLVAEERKQKKIKKG